MSRIAGLMTWGGPRQRAALLRQMLSASSANGTWRSQDERASACVLGWCGWRTSNTARMHDLIVVMDGRIVNRAALGAYANDALLVAALTKRHGFEGTIQQLNGDFAIALYDEPNGMLWLARDRCGVKPLYYTVRDGGLAFASRPRPLLQLPGVSRRVRRDYVGILAASHYSVFDHEPGRSPYEAILQLPAGHLLQFAAGRVTQRAYWSLQEQPEFTEPEETLAERYRALLLDAVRLRLPSASRPVFTLSGGMDSSSVLACSVMLTGRKQDAISTVYDDATYDESREIQTALGDLVARWHPIRVHQPDILTLVERMIDQHDEPVGTATWLSHELLCAEAKRLGYDTLFGGLGGDELNAGEYNYFFDFFADLDQAGRHTELAQEVAQWVVHHDHPVFRKNAEVLREGLARLVDRTQPGRCLPDLQRICRYASALNPDYFDLHSFEPVVERVFASYLKNRTRHDIFAGTLPCCVRAEDRQATAHDLDNVLPFVDYRLVEFMFRVPGTLKIRHGVTKHLLRQAMRGLVPQATRTRIKKTGWNAPAHRWFTGRGGGLVRDVVQSSSFRQRGIYDVPRVLALLDEHERIVSSGAPQENHMMFFWQLVNLERWLRWLDEQPTVIAAGADPTRRPQAVEVYDAARGV